MCEVVVKNYEMYRKDIPALQAKYCKLGDEEHGWKVFGVIKKEPLQIQTFATCETKDQAEALLKKISIVNNEIKLG